MNDSPLILVVDDESHIRHVVRLKLQNAGYEVITASDGEEGLAAALEHRPNLVITDFQMPFMDGLELCNQLKAHPATCHIPAIMLTARGHSLEFEPGQQTNIVEVLTKPFSSREVVQRVHQLIESSRCEGSASSR